LQQKKSTACTSTGICAGSAYDALIARCALKAKAKAIYTWNVTHFNRLGESIASPVRQP
jgi:hypothetical protein